MSRSTLCPGVSACGCGTVHARDNCSDGHRRGRTLADDLLFFPFLQWPPVSLITTLLDRGARFAFAAAASTYLFTAGVFSARHRALIAHIARHFGYDRQGVRASLPSISIGSVADVSHPILMRVPDAVDGNVTIAELTALCLITRTLRPRQIFEIGTFDGRTTLALADNAPEARVVTLDLPRAQLAHTALTVAPEERHLIDKAASGGHFASRDDVRERIVQCWGDSATFDYGPYLGACELVFVDGSHAFEYVRNDSERALALVGSRGLVVWHDYGEWPGVTRALNEYAASDPRFANLTRIAGTTLALLPVGISMMVPSHNTTS